SPGAFHHIVATIHTRQERLFIDGELQGTCTEGAQPDPASVPFVIGARSNEMSGWFEGAIDEVAFYSPALPDSRVAVHYHAARPSEALSTRYERHERPALTARSRSKFEIPMMTEPSNLRCSRVESAERAVRKAPACGRPASDRGFISNFEP